MPANKLKLYNTLSRKVETFTPFNAGEVKIYTCGPTVYSQPHIGNFAAYIYWDLLIRTLRAQGYSVKRVLNLTDVGHLTSDADDGEDKLEKGARLTGKTVWEVAEFYIDKFLADYSALDLTPPDLLARATDYIPEDIELVDILTAKGYTYETRDGIYYNTAKFPHYADFARLDLDNLKAGARVEFSDEKLNPSDFAVWKFIQPGEKHEMRWDYLGRPGYPGWHLECSTIIHTELGETIDIHAGGIDHIPTHHTNEIAQSEAAFEKKLAKYWIHCNHLTSEGQKISKSLGNGYSLADLAEKGYSPLDFKMWVLQGHYQSERDFSLENLEAARIRRLNWRNRIAKCYQTSAGSSTTTSDAIADIIDALDDNLNSPKAFAIIDAVTNDDLDFWQQIDHLFGLGLLSDSPELGSAAKKLLEERQAARAAKDFATSDRLRDELLAQNISVLDSKDGQIWQYAR
jgi:cysteinyl-tRNA synthetase